MTIVKSTGSHFLCYEPLIQMFTEQNLWHIIIQNRCMSQGLNQYPMVTNVHSVSELLTWGSQEASWALNQASNKIHRNIGQWCL